MSAEDQDDLGEQEEENAEEPEETDEDEAQLVTEWPTEAKNSEAALKMKRAEIARANFVTLQGRYQAGVSQRVANQPTDTGHLFVLAESVLEIFGTLQSGYLAPVTYGNDPGLQIKTVDDYKEAREKTVAFCTYFTELLKKLYADFAYVEAKVSKYKKGEADIFIAAEATKLRLLAREYGLSNEEDWEALYDEIRRRLIDLLPPMTQIVQDTLAEGNLGGRGGFRSQMAPAM